MGSDLTDCIRQAIGSEDYGTALTLWNDYAGRLRDELARGTIDEERMAETRELFKWSRTALLCARAHKLDRLNAIHVAGAYAGTS